MAKPSSYISPKTYSKIPKNVWADIAYSFAVRITGEDAEAAHRLLSAEWEALFAAGVIPQEPKPVRNETCYACDRQMRVTCPRCKRDACCDHFDSGEWCCHECIDEGGAS